MRTDNKAIIRKAIKSVCSLVILITVIQEKVSAQNNSTYFKVGCTAGCFVGWKASGAFCYTKPPVSAQGNYNVRYFCSDGGFGSSGHCAAVGDFTRSQTDYAATVYYYTISNLGTINGSITFGVGQSERFTSLPGGSTFSSVNISSVSSNAPPTNTGQQGFATRTHYPEGTVESNSQNGPNPYFPDVTNLNACPVR